MKSEQDKSRIVQDRTGLLALNLCTLAAAEARATLGWCRNRADRQSAIDRPGKASQDIRGPVAVESTEAERGTDSDRSEGIGPVDPAALALLNRLDARLLPVESAPDAVGLWSDLDGPDVRSAIRAAGLGDRVVQYLDGQDVPMRYKARKIPGEPVPLSVLAAMEQAEREPWRVRDQMLRAMGWRATAKRPPAPQGSLSEVVAAIHRAIDQLEVA